MLQIISGPATLHPADAFLAVDDGAAAALVEAAIRYGLQRVATEHVGLDTGRSAGFVDDLGGVAGLPILIVIDDIDRDGLDARCLAVLVDIAADVFLAERVEAPEVHRNLVADLADEPFILLERHPVARAPAMVAVAGGVDLDHALAATQRDPDAAGPFDASGRATARPPARGGCISIAQRDGG